MIMSFSRFKQPDTWSPRPYETNSVAPIGLLVSTRYPNDTSFCIMCRFSRTLVSTFTLWLRHFPGVGVEISLSTGCFPSKQLRVRHTVTVRRHHRVSARLSLHIEAKIPFRLLIQQQKPHLIVESLKGRVESPSRVLCIPRGP